MMGCLMAFALAALLVPSGASAQSAATQRAFAEGNRRYADSAYAAAADAYQRVLHTGYASGALYYNLGNAHFRMGEMGQAIRYYEKARRHRPPTDRLAHNLSVARSRLDVPSPGTPTGWMRWLHLVNASQLFGLGLLLYLLGLGLGGATTWLRNATPLSRRVAGSLGLGGLLLVGLALTASWTRTADDRAVVVAGPAPLHATPQASAPTDTTLPEGLMLRRGARQGAWTAVRLPDGTRGWLRSETLGGI